MKIHYDCSKCPGYCCSYPNIELVDGDLVRLAEHLKMAKAEVLKRHTVRSTAEDDGGSGTNGKNGKARPRALKHVDDKYFGTICGFLDQETRRCTVYEARPKICREFPGTRRCGYYDFLSFERKVQDDPEYIAVTGN